mmetsp:Transcript_15672/g.36739  ORF Transcript_15672/g.36739 Transcript_15672/m.36739 type:complete len:549 (+) Transcript_15672:163-1809(+)
MWARRLGVPHLWPSRVKVFFLGLLTSVFIFSVFQYLHSANVEYLDLERPGETQIVCKLPRPECRREQDPVRCTAQLSGWAFWEGLNVSNDPCPTLPAQLEDQTCTNPSIPLDAITGDLGTLHTVNTGVNPFQLWALLFLILTSLLALSILIHDLALLEESLRPQILSIPQMRYATPCFWDCMRCFQCRRCLRTLWKKHRGVWMAIIPFYLIFQMVSFMALIYPLAFVVFLITPVRMSRIMVFLSGILCMLWSIVFVLTTTMWDTDDMYSVLWSPVAPARPSDSELIMSQCICLCQFPLSRSVMLRIAALGIGVCWHSFNLTFRALKGLRRAQWANMFSVLHSVPIEAFPVSWDNTPLRWRKEGEAVQSEPAFDPFCLMDEQPDSAWLRVTLRPTQQTAQQQLMWEPFTGTLDTEIGCCGFPERPLVSQTDLTNDGRPYEKEDLEDDENDQHNGSGAHNGHVVGKTLSEHDDDPEVARLSPKRVPEPRRRSEGHSTPVASSDTPRSSWNWFRNFLETPSEDPLFGSGKDADEDGPLPAGGSDALRRRQS